MLARVKPDARWPIVTACGGFEFVKHELRPVPVGREEEALINEYLQVELSKSLEASGQKPEPNPPVPETIEPEPTYTASPAAIKLADDSGVFLGEVEGTGKAGLITVGDVKKAIDALIIEEE